MTTCLHISWPSATCPASYIAGVGIGHAVRSAFLGPFSSKNSSRLAANGEKHILKRIHFRYGSRQLYRTRALNHGQLKVGTEEGRAGEFAERLRPRRRSVIPVDCDEYCVLFMFRAFITLVLGLQFFLLFFVMVGYLSTCSALVRTSDAPGSAPF